MEGLMEGRGVMMELGGMGIIRTMGTNKAMGLYRAETRRPYQHTPRTVCAALRPALPALRPIPPPRRAAPRPVEALPG